ncbi:MAG: hypothetical protein M0Z33_02130 [Actinomycetota bacterium]|nr:hypothetical protein [Actinomycetota bacterium]
MSIRELELGLAIGAGVVLELAVVEVLVVLALAHVARGRARRALWRAIRSLAGPMGRHARRRR